MILINLAIISIYAGVAYLFVQPFNNFLLLVLGLILGFALLKFDEKIGFKFYKENQQLGQNPGLISRSIIFLFAYVPLSLFVITSSGSPLGVGMIVSMGFTYSLELWQVKKSPELFVQKFLWQTGKPWSQKEVVIFTRVFITIVILLAILTLT